MDRAELLRRLEDKVLDLQRQELKLVEERVDLEEVIDLLKEQIKGK